MTRPDLTAVSLFAGIGGIDLALQRAGIRVVAAVEIDPACRAVLARQFPGVALLEDVREVTGEQLRAAGFVAERGLVAGGWPCQGNSSAGRRLGLADPRSGLWLHFARLLAELRPRWVLAENVPGLYTVNGGADIAIVRRDLAQLGYWWAERVLDAQYFGVPQQRNRIYFVGCAGDRRAPVAVLLEPEGRPGHHPPSAEARPRVAGTLAASAGSGGLGGVGQSGAAISARLVETTGALTAGSLTDYDDNTARAGFMVSYALTGHHSRDTREQSYVVSTLQGGGERGYRIDAEGAAGGHLIANPITGWAGRQPGEDGTGRGLPIIAFANGHDVAAGGSATANAITASKGQPGSVAAATGVRRLTPTECERLQGFPDGWTAGQKDAPRYRQLGNAVAVPVAEWVARRIVKEEQRED